MKNKPCIIAKLLVVGVPLCLATSVTTPTFATNTNEQLNSIQLDSVQLDSAINDLAIILQEKVTNPKVESIGGEWSVIGLARSGVAVPQSYFDDYLATLKQYLQLRDGVLHEKKYSEYSRVVLALTALGHSPVSIARYDVLQPLSDFGATTFQGVNGAIWALLALDSLGYTFAESNGDIRQSYLDYILQYQLPDGGFGVSVSATKSDIDMTAMALQAIAKYRNINAVATACDNAVAYLSEIQAEDGGFFELESTIQVALGLLAIDVSLDDVRFIKNGNTIVSNLMSHYIKTIGFVRTPDDTAMNLMATEQGFLGLVAIQRQRQGKTKLYDMSDVLAVPTPVVTEIAEAETIEAEIVEVETTEAETTEVEPESRFNRIPFTDSDSVMFFLYADKMSKANQWRNPEIIGLWALAIQPF